MFVTPLAGASVTLQPLAAKLGCKVGEIEGSREFPRFRVALSGNTFAVKDQLKAAGFRFCGQNKVWFVADYAAMSTFLNAL